MKPRRHRILYVQRPTGGGSAASLYELLRGLDREVYEPVVLFHTPSFYREKFEALGGKVITLTEAALSSPLAGSQRRMPAGPKNKAAYRAVREVYRSLRKDLSIARGVARLIKEEAIDLVHQNNGVPGSRATVIGARFAKVPQVCHVRFLHNYSYIDRYLARFLDYFIYISQAVEQNSRDLGIPYNNGRIVYNPIDVEAFKHPGDGSGLRSELGLTDQDRVICNVGRLVSWKGQDLFLQAVAEVVQSYPATKALIVGGRKCTASGEAYYQRLLRLVAHLNLSGHVIFTGFRSDIPRIMAASDIVVHSACEPEPFGRVVVEAMAAGRPVIATAAGGVLEIIDDQVNGVTVPLNDAAAMAKAIQKLLLEPERARSMGQRAQQDVRDRFSVERHVTAVQRIYEQTFASRHHMPT